VTIDFIHPDKRPLAMKKGEMHRLEVERPAGDQGRTTFRINVAKQEVVVHLGVIYDIPEFNQSVRRAV
jgi:hypothetical protein